MRFIELMRTADNAAYFADRHVSGERLKTWLDQEGWSSRARASDDGPATEYQHPDFGGRIGLIAPYGAGFCDGCNRLRATAQGLLRLCLFGHGGVSLRDLLTGKASSHELARGQAGDTRNLAQFGG